MVLLFGCPVVCATITLAVCTLLANVAYSLISTQFTTTPMFEEWKYSIFVEQMNTRKTYVCTFTSSFKLAFTTLWANSADDNLLYFC